jgi:hypothetical protein
MSNAVDRVADAAEAVEDEAVVEDAEKPRRRELQRRTGP